MSALARQGISKDAYLRIAGKDEESLAHDAEPDAASALRREAVLAAIVAAEKIEPSDEELVEALRPAAERDGSDPAELVAQLRKAGRLESLREDVASRQAVELLVREAQRDHRRSGQGSRKALDARAKTMPRARPSRSGRLAAEAVRPGLDGHRPLLQSAGIRVRKRKKRGR